MATMDTLRRAVGREVRGGRETAFKVSSLITLSYPSSWGRLEKTKVNIQCQ
jgi:hypothetical protein